MAKTDCSGRCIALSPPPLPPRLGPLHPCEGLVLPSGAQLGSPPDPQCLQTPGFWLPRPFLALKIQLATGSQEWGSSEWGDRRRCGVLPGFYLQTQVTV